MINRLVFLLLFALALFGAAAAARAQRPATAPANLSGLSPAEAQQIIDRLLDPQQRAQLIETLRVIAKAPPPEAKPAAAPAVTLAPNGLGAQLASQLSSWPELLAGEAAITAQTITDFPLLWRRGARFVADPDEHLAALSGLWQLGLVVVGALLVEWLARLALARPITALAAYVPKRERGDGTPETAPRHSYRAGTMLRRLPSALARLALDLIPVGVFWGVGSLFAGLTPSPLTRDATLIIINAYAASRATMAVGGMLVSPATGRLRLVQLGDDEAESLIRWLRRITIVAVFGSALASLALLFGLNQGAYETLIRIVALITAVLLGILVLRGRRTVALRLGAPPGAEGGVARWRNWLAGTWHYLALIVIVAGWIVWAAGIRNGLGGLRLLVGSVAILVLARLMAIIVFGMLDRMARLS